MRRAATADHRLLTGVVAFGLLIAPACEGVVEATPIDLDGSESDGGSDEASDTGESTSDTGEEDSGTTSSPLASFRVVVFADPHIVGPEYQGGDPNLMGTKAQLTKVRDAVAAIDPPPDFAIVLGDLVHEAYASTDANWYESDPSAFSEVDDLLASFPVPVYPVFGESDYGVPEAPKTLSHLLFANFFQRPPNYSFEHEGWRFVVANSQLGPTHEPANVDFDTNIGSEGPMQLTELGNELYDPIPTVLLSHIPLFQSLPNEAPNNGAYPDIEAVVSGASQLRLILAGHTHTWNSMPRKYAAPHIVFGATRYDTDNFLLIEFFEDGSYEILDLAKVQWGTPNADTWDYQGTPKPG